MFPAELPSLSFSRTSVNVVHFAPFGKKKDAASSAINHLSLKRIGQVITTLVPSSILHTPSGLLALSLVQFGTLLPNLHKAFSRHRLASGERLVIGNPKTSASGCLAIQRTSDSAAVQGHDHTQIGERKRPSQRTKLHRPSTRACPELCRTRESGRADPAFLRKAQVSIPQLHKMARENSLEHWLFDGLGEWCPPPLPS